MKLPDARYNIKMAIIIIFAIVLLTLLCISVISFYKTGEEATVGIFSLGVTLLGTLFIAVELRNSQNVTCSEMLIDLNNYFHDSDRLMKVYAVLENCETDPHIDADDFKDIQSVEIAHYCTFFENLYLLYRHHVAEIEDLDDLFGYRFFIFVNNPYIQEHYILPTSSSYVQIFKLYDVWIKYREKSGKKDWKKQIPLYQFHFPKDYLENELYMVDADTVRKKTEKFEAKGKQFTLERLSCNDISEIMNLQQQCVEALPSAEIYSPLTRGELIESATLDTLVGIYSDNHLLVAAAIIVSNRASKRNLATNTGDAQEAIITFDAVFVSPYWRGYGFQKLLIDYCIRQAKSSDKIRKIVATVAPDNVYSESNFIAAGFKIVGHANKYGGLKRNILAYSIK